MHTINSFINQNYNIIYCHPDSNQNDWDTFLLGEDDHEDEIAKAVNGEFLKLFSNNQSILLLEGIPSLQVDPRTRKSTNAHSHVYIGPSFTTDRVFGWDSDNYCRLDIKRTIILMAKKILEPYQYLDKKNNRKLLKDLNITQKFQLVISAEEKRCLDQENSAESQFLIGYFEELKKVALEMAEEITGFIKNEVFEIEKKIETQQLKLADLIEEEQRLQNFSDEYTTICEQEIVMSSEIHQLRSDVQRSVQKKYLELQQKSWTLFDTLFPERTQAMIKTLNNIRSIVGENKKTFLIAGSAHLREVYGKLPEDHPKSLKELYTYLSNKKNIVLLIPKKKTIPSVDLTAL